jgi:glutathione synthase/RimK-type ligase-like ATP-grasp enzyme
VLPEPLAALCLRYLHALGLEYAAFDFVREGEAVWFLEANQAGEWAFIDRAADLGIADSLARRLVALARQGA